MKPRLSGRLKAALRGKRFYHYVTVTRDGEGVRGFVSSVAAFSLSTAIHQIALNHPGTTIRSISEQGVSIEHVIAYPCRFARWVFTYRKMRGVELDAVKAVLLLQTRQSSLREINGGRAALEPPVATDRLPTFAAPDDRASAPEGCGKAVAVDRIHDSTLPTSL